MASSSQHQQEWGIFGTVFEATGYWEEMFNVAAPGVASLQCSNYEPECGDQHVLHLKQIYKINRGTLHSNVLPTLTPLWQVMDHLYTLFLFLFLFH